MAHEPNPFSVIPAEGGTHEYFNETGVEKRTGCAACELTAKKHVRLVSWVPAFAGMTN